jgi:hypothetical protein
MDFQPHASHAITHVRLVPVQTPALLAIRPLLSEDYPQLHPIVFVLVGIMTLTPSFVRLVIILVLSAQMD